MKAPESPLHQAARLGNWGAVETLLGQGADPRGVDREGQTIVHRMAASWDWEDELLPYVQNRRHPQRIRWQRLIKALGERSLHIDAPNDSGDSALCWHIKTDQAEVPLTSWALLVFGARFDMSKLCELKQRVFLRSLADVVYLSQEFSRSRLSEILKDLRQCLEIHPRLQYLTDKACKLAMQERNLDLAWPLLENGAKFDRFVMTRLFKAEIRYLRSSEHAFGHSFEEFLDFLITIGADASLRTYNPIHFLLHLGNQHFFKHLDCLARVIETLLNHSWVSFRLDHLNQSILIAALGPCSECSSPKRVLPLLMAVVRSGFSSYQPLLTILYEALPSPRGPGYRCQLQHLHHYSRRVLRPGHCLSSSPLAMAKDPAVADILIRSGACSNRELFHWNRYLAENKNNYGKNNGVPTETLDVIEQHSRQIPTLLSLSRLALSRALRLGPRRRKALEQLNLPLKIRRYVSFDDLQELAEARLRKIFPV